MMSILITLDVIFAGLNAQNIHQILMLKKETDIKTRSKITNILRRLCKL